MITFTDLQCRCCGSDATVTMDGEKFHGGSCPKCGPLLTCPTHVHAELVKRVRAASEEPRPDGYHYVYIDQMSGKEVIVHDSGQEWNGQKPLRAAPYYYDPASKGCVLDAPADVWGTMFGKGVPWSTVIGCAQRHATERATRIRGASTSDPSIAIQLLTAESTAKVQLTDKMIERGGRYLASIAGEAALDNGTTEQRKDLAREMLEIALGCVLRAEA